MAHNMFLKLTDPTVRGEATDSSHREEIQVLSWNHAFTQPTPPTRSSGGAGTVQQANHSDFAFTKYIDASTDDLLKLCWSGRRVGKGVFCCYRRVDDQKSVKYLEIIMENIIVSNLSIGGGTGDIPTETVTLSYGSVEYKYFGPQPDGQTGQDVQRVKHDLGKESVW